MTPEERAIRAQRAGRQECRGPHEKGCSKETGCKKGRSDKTVMKPIPLRAPTLQAQPSSVAMQRHYTIAEVAKTWSLSQSTVLRIFKSEPGVLRLGNVNSRKRVKISLRIPENVAERVWARLTQK